MATKMLLEEGADPGLKNHLGLSALDFAQYGPHKEESTSYIQAFLASWNARYPVKP
jgi:ankyrin repeat protein